MRNRMSKVVLMYHDIVTSADKYSGFQNESAFQYKIDESVFENQVKALQGKDVVFTFDDGGVSFYSKAAPILEKYGFKGVFFISTRYINTPGFLTDDQVRVLAERGHVIGSHTHSHPNNLTLMTESEIEYEWRKSCEVLKNIIGHEVIVASIPNGYGSQRIFRLTSNAGIRELYTSEPTQKIYQKENVTAIGRYVIHNNMTTEDVVSLVVKKDVRRRIYIRWKLLECVKALFGSKYDKLKSLYLKLK